MKVTKLRQKATDKCITEVIEYSSLSEFYDYIMNLLEWMPAKHG